MNADPWAAAAAKLSNKVPIKADANTQSNSSSSTEPPKTEWSKEEWESWNKIPSDGPNKNSDSNTNAKNWLNHPKNSTDKQKQKRASSLPQKKIDRSSLPPIAQYTPTDPFCFKDSPNEICNVVNEDAVKFGFTGVALLNRDTLSAKV